MASPGEPAGSTAAPAPAGLAEAGAYATADEGFDHGLVVLAMGLSFWLFPSDHGYRLLVDAPAAAAVQDELARFDRESAGWPPRPAPAERPARSLDWPTPLAWALGVLVVFGCQGEWPGVLERACVLDAGAVFGRGEWWRLATALFLHANTGHLVSNLLSGFFVLAAVVTTMGRARGWLLVALAAVVGNLAAAALHRGGPYQSLGASTAIFAGLGLLTGRAIRVLGRPGRRHPWRAVIAPLAAGLALLGLFGTGDARTDVAAHAAGFTAGLILGLAAGLPRGRRIPPPARPGGRYLEDA